MAEQKIHVMFPSITGNKEIREEGNLVRLTADYFPLVSHSGHFCYLTRDENPIHFAHSGYREAVSPGLLQICVASILVREAMKYKGINPADYVFSSSRSEMSGPVLTGCDYRFEIQLDTSHSGQLKSSARLMDKKSNLVCILEREDLAKKPAIFYPSLNSSCLVHSGVFNSVDILDFGNLIGSESPESNLYAMAGSSSIVFDALFHKKLDALPEGLLALYSSQTIHSDTSASLDLHKKGINLELYLSNPEKFGKLSEKGDTVDVKILARDSKGRFIYLSHAPLSFQKSRLLDVMMKREFRNS